MQDDSIILPMVLFIILSVDRKLDFYMKKKLYILVLAYLAICALMSAIKGSVAIAMFGLLVFLLILLVTFWFANKFVKTTLWYKSTIPDMSLYPTNEWYREHLERNFDVVNIGSSSAKYAFDYSGLPVKAFNWESNRNY